MTSSPVVSLCLQRENAVGRLLEVLGPSDPRVAKKQSQFFLRGSFGEDSVQNAFYGMLMESKLVHVFLPRNSVGCQFTPLSESYNNLQQQQLYLFHHTRYKKAK